MFDWDKDNIGHVAAHAVTPEEAEQVLLNDPVDDGVQDHGDEERHVEIGVTNAMRILVVITTMRKELIRVVIAYPAPPNFRDFYLQEKGRHYEHG
jgi:uncharacterized protein